MYDGMTCNGTDAGVGAAVAVGTIGTCATNASVFDLSGNVWEWENGCVNNQCRIRGGSFNNDANALTCDIDSTASRFDTMATMGFRCCADAQQM